MSCALLSLAAIFLTALPPPRLDVHGDPLPPGAAARLGTVRLRHGGLVRGVALSPDGKRLASCGDDHAVRVWDAATGRPVRLLDGHTDVVHEVAFSPDGKLLASASDDTTVRLWDASTGKELRRLVGHGKHVRWVAFSPDGKLLASASWGDVPLLLWDVATGKELSRFEKAQHSLDAVHFTPDGKTLVTADRRTVGLWDVTTGKLTRRLGGPKSYYGNATAVSPDGKTLALAGFNRGILLWDLASGEELRLLPGHRCGVWALAFSPDAKTLASGSSCAEPIRLWDVASGEPVREFPGHQSSVSSLCFSRDGRTLASGSWDHTARLWDVGTGRDLLPLGGHGAAVEGVAFAPDGKTVATGGYDGTLRLWDGAGRPLRTLTWPDAGAAHCLAFSADGKALLCADMGGQVGRWDPGTGRALGAFRTAPRLYRAMAFAPGGGLVAYAGAAGGGVGVRETVTGIEVARPNVRAPFVLSAKGTFLIGYEAPRLAPPESPFTGGFERTPPPDGPGDGKAIVVCEVRTGRAIRRMPVEPGTSVPLALSPDGRTLARADYDDGHYLVSLWEVASGGRRGELRLGADRVHCLEFAPDGRRLAVGQGSAAEVWDVATARRVACLTGHAGDVTALAFAPDGRRLVSGGGDTTALVWELAAPVGAPSGRLGEGELEAVWRDLASADAPSAYRAVNALAAAPEVAAPWLGRRLVAAPEIDAGQIRKWIAELDDRSYAVRERAARRLADVGEPAEAPLREALAGSLPLEAGRRARAVLTQVEARVFPPERLRGVRAVEALERIGTDVARRILSRLAGGAPGAWLTEEARTALARCRINDR